MTVHTLKCWPEPFAALKSEIKSFEIRNNDRNFEVCDVLQLQEWNPIDRKYTGRELFRRVTLILSNPEFGVKPDYVVMAVVPCTDQSGFLPKEGSEKGAND